MPRPARQVLPGVPHHVTQRGNCRQPIFFGDDDHAFYLSLLSHNCRKGGISVWAWCLMPNHVHLILAPSHAERLRAAPAPISASAATASPIGRRCGGGSTPGSPTKTATPSAPPNAPVECRPGPGPAAERQSRVNVTSDSHFFASSLSL